MKNIDLSLNGILDERWNLELIGENKVKLTYNSVKGIPSVEETKDAITKILEIKKLDSIYISGKNGDVLVKKGNIVLNDQEKKKKSFLGTDIYGEPDGAELGLLKHELEEMEK